MTSTALPLADAAELRARGRRTRVAQLVALALVGLAAVALVLAATRLDPARQAFSPPGASAIVVLDVSASISSETYDRIAATLDRLADSNGRFGLVLFSDTAYLALPPGTPASELRPFVRFFRVPRQVGGVLPAPPPSPWTDTFSAGTRISTGLERALTEIRESRLRRPAVVLVSDLDDDTGDLDRMTQVVVAYRRAGIPLHVVGLDPSPEDASLVRALLVEPSDLSAAPSRETASSRFVADRAGELAAAAALLAVVLAALLLVTQRMRWRSA